MKLVVDVRELVDLNRRLASLGPELRDRAIAAALNKVAAKGKTVVVRAIRDEYVIDANRVRNSISVRPASAARFKFEAAIDIFGSASRRGRSLNTIHFLEKKVSFAEARRRGKRGDLFVRNGRTGQLHPILRFQIKRGAAGKVIEGAFVGNKGRTVFMRTGKERLPIVPVQVIDVNAMFRSRKVTRRVLERINRELPIEMDRAVTSVLARLKNR